MLRLQRALLLELALTLVIVVGVLTAIIFGGLALNLLARVGEGMGTPLLVNLMPQLLPTALVYSLPFSWLVTVCMVLGRWVNDHEVTSIRAAGVHVRALVLPVAAFSVLLALTGMALAGIVVPQAVQQVQRTTRDYLPTFLGSLKDVNRSMALGSGRLSWDRYANGVFYDAEIDRRDYQGRLETKVLAHELSLSQFHLDGEGTGLTIDVKQGYVIQAGNAEPRVVPAAGGNLRLAQVERLGGSTLFNPFLGLPRYLPRARDLGFFELVYAQERGGLWRSPPRQVQVALHGRLALGAAALPMGLFALGLALLLPPSGRRVRDFLAAFVPSTLIYFPLSLAAPGLAQALPVPVWIVMWAPGLVLGSLALGLLAWAYRR